MMTLFELNVTPEERDAYFPDMPKGEGEQTVVELSTIPAQFGKKTAKGLRLDVVSLRHSDACIVRTFSICGRHPVVRIPLASPLPPSRKQFRGLAEQALRQWLNGTSFPAAEHPYTKAVRAYLSA